MVSSPYVSFLHIKSTFLHIKRDPSSNNNMQIWEQDAASACNLQSGGYLGWRERSASGFESDFFNTLIQWKLEGMGCRKTNTAII